MTMDEFVTDMAARAFAEFAESNPRLKELAEKDDNKTATPEEEAEFFKLMEEASMLFSDGDLFYDPFPMDDDWF